MENQLWERYAQGDQAAFNEIYNTYCKYLTGIANNIVKCPDTAHDVVHDVFVNMILVSRRNYVCTGKFKNLLIRSTINRSLDYMGQIKRSQSITKALKNSPEEVATDATYQIGLEEFGKFAKDALTKTERKVLDLKMNGYSLDEIAQETGSCKSTVKVHLRNIKAAICDFKSAFIN